MARIGPDESELDEAERMAQTSDQTKGGWTRTLEDMRAMAADREESGYETLTVQAGNTAPIGPEQGDDEKWGLFYVIPGDVAEAVSNLLQETDFDETAVYQASIGQHTFIVTEAIDHDADQVFMIAGSYRRAVAPPLVRTAVERDRMYTHVKKLDGTYLGTVEHEDPSAFFPDPDSIYAYEQSR